ncbi:hypothetical protein VB713_08390 [Anabaena cylindrica UHCC 0172]|uniref:hypothetical protein n=1 Tax=Anabaena cylindrica TaxID=1165 RepID=UPI002B21DC11|nr:hypothetical protein [Anabaena cylindrica]MEA5550995.1 hypothetical protein [Anabaena cylindrica UHCC 0172]
MRDDLEGLEITNHELQKLTNLPVNNELIIVTNNIQKLGKYLLDKIKGSEGATVIFISCSIFAFTYLLFDLLVKLFAAWITIPSWLLLFWFGVWVGGIIQTILYLLWINKREFVKTNITNSLRILLNDVERYNDVIKAININDQIEAAGNPEVAIKQREKVIEALKLTKSDLIRALKTEKILRENKNFILNNSDLFANNLATLTSMQVTEQASEHGRLLNEALQIALDVQYEMRKLHSHG